MEAAAGNWISSLALALWPAAGVYLFLTRKRSKAIFWTIVGGQLLLPVATSIKIAGVPEFDKFAIPNLTALLCCLLISKERFRFWKDIGLTEILLAAALVSPFITAELNSDPIFLPHQTLPAETIYDAMSAAVRQFFLLIPFLLGRQAFRSEGDIETVLYSLTFAGLIYTFPILFEIRFSPQLHYWLYGYYPSEFLQSMRDGGFRPMVFLGHGLLVSLFLAMSFIASATLWRTRRAVASFRPALISAYLGFVLVLCKSLGSVLYAAVLFPLVRWFKPRNQIRIAVLMACISLLYPMLRYADWIPTRSLVEAASSVSTERAGSLEFRFQNEDRLLSRAYERLTFGWGRFGRSRVYQENTGYDISVTDGRWIIVLGEFGLFGFATEFALLTFPIFRAAAALRYASTLREQANLAGLGIVLAVNVFDLLPNSGLTPWTWLLAGALLGRSEELLAFRTAGWRRPEHTQTHRRSMSI